jgi:hypothetical protein
MVAINDATITFFIITFLLVLGLNNREMRNQLPDLQKRQIEMDCFNRIGSKQLHQNNFQLKCQIKNRLEFPALND